MIPPALQLVHAQGQRASDSVAGGVVGFEWRDALEARAWVQWHAEGRMRGVAGVDTGLVGDWGEGVA